MVLETDLLIRPRATGIIIPPTDIKSTFALNIQ